MKKIDVMIVGAEKSGTTSLKNYLNEHPDVFGHSATEFTFFHNKKNEYKLGFDIVFEKYYDLNNFHNGNKIIAKNASIHTIEESIERLNKHNSKCKLIYCIRNPVDRAYSEYTYDISNNRIENKKNEEIKQVIVAEDIKNRFFRNYIGHSLYHIHIDMMYKFFPKKNIKVVVLEELNRNPESTMKKIFEFIQVDENQCINTKKVYNKTSTPKSTIILKMIYYLRTNKQTNNFIKFFIPFKLYKKIGMSLIKSNKSNKNFKPINNELKIFLTEYFKPHNKKLEKVIDMDLSIWNH